jgi:fatty-acyl-CoA synthase
VPTIPRRLERWAKSKPHETFCTFLSEGRAENITFLELYERSFRYAQHYARLGVRPGDVIIIILKHTPHLFYGFLGAMLAGAVPSFMPFPTPKQRPELYWADHEALFARIKPRAILTYEQNAREVVTILPGFSIPLIVAADEIVADEPDAPVPPLPHEAGPDELACLQHSSGTTNLKKGVMLTHREILDHVDSYSRALAFGPGDSIASWLPLYHDMGFVACFMGSVVGGTRLVALDPFEWTIRPHLLFDAIDTYRTTFCWLPNFAFSHLVNTARRASHWDLSSIRAFVNCSEPCKAQTFERFLDRFAPCGVTAERLQVCYAMAENVFGVTQTALDRPVRVVRLDAEAFARNHAVPAVEGRPAVSVVSCGAPIDGVALKIVHGEREEPPGRIGEIHVSSPFLFAGYHELPELTSRKLQNGWYATGDMGFILDGELYVTGRIDDMIIVNGRNYYSHELEAVVNAVEGVLPGRNIAIGVEDERTDATTVVVLAEIAPAADAARIARDVLHLISETTGLAVHAVVPLARGELVKTTSGKISRNKNKQLFLAGAFASAS